MKHILASSEYYYVENNYINQNIVKVEPFYVVEIGVDCISASQDVGTA